ncbi:MAG TPA: thioredoxin family protein [Burkholderiales bacterium]|nr:thioredoxin family protein [Burkholderiales bacterium]
MQHPVASKEDWLAARKALLVKEKELTRARDALAAERRALPWVKVDKAYVFDSANGKVTLADLFEHRDQLMIYHFMFSPDWEAGCTGCSFLCDHVDAARQHFEHDGLSFAAVSRTSVDKIEAYKRRMGWTFRWVSSLGSDFNYDFHVSFRKEALEAGPVDYNFRPQKLSMEDMHGESLFFKDADGTIYHTYSSYERAGEEIAGTYRFLDLAPLGRNEGSNGNMSKWMRRHDEYERAT